MIKLTIKGFKDITKALDEEEKNILASMAKAHSFVASNAVQVLKQGLRIRAGRDRSDKNYASSPKGSLPYMHTGRLRDSIGFKLLRYGTNVLSEVGSGANGHLIEYAQYLEGKNGNGIRPFLWAIDKIYNAKNILKAFDDYYKIRVGK